MTIQMIENWSDILGVVEAVESSEDLEDFDLLVVWVERVEQVEGYPNLVATFLEQEPEPRLKVLAPVEIVTQFEITAGVVLECRVRRAGPERMFVQREKIIVHRPDQSLGE
jgi:hypothetical protein